MAYALGILTGALASIAFLAIVAWRIIDRNW